MESSNFKSEAYGLQNLIDLSSQVDTLMLHAFDNPFNQSLTDGQLGIALVLHHYASLMENQEVQDFVSYLMDYVISRAAMLPKLDLENGLMGLGWGIEYLVQSGMVDSDAAEICEEIDLYLQTVNLIVLCQKQDTESLSGILNYLLVHYSNMPVALQQHYLVQFPDILEDIQQIVKKSSASFSEIPYLCHRFSQLMKTGIKQRGTMKLSRFIIHHSHGICGYGLRSGLAGEVETALERIQGNICIT